MEVCLRFKNFNRIVVCILIFTEPRPFQTFSDWSSRMKSYTASSLKRLKINLASTTSPFSINYKIRKFQNLNRHLIGTYEIICGTGKSRMVLKITNNLWSFTFDPYFSILKLKKRLEQLEFGTEKPLDTKSSLLKAASQHLPIKFRIPIKLIFKTRLPFYR